MMVGATGIIPDHSDDLEPNLYHPLFASVLQQYQNRTPIVVPGSFCNGTCRTEVVAPGWDIHCTQSARPFRLISESEEQQEESDITLASNGTILSNGSYTGPAETQTMFSVQVVYNSTLTSIRQAADYGGMNYNIILSAQYKATPGGNGTMGIHQCTLYEALVRYPLQMQNNTVTLGPMPASENRTVEQIIRQDESEGQGGTY